MRKILLLAIGSALFFGARNTNAQDTKIRFFGQPEINSSSIKETNRFLGVSGTGQYIKKDTSYSKTNFNTGNYVLFVTSQLSERVSVLSEASFNNDGGEFKFDVQRLLLRYYIRDYFSVRVGKMFTPIGYWNNQFTLGLVLQPTIQRPLAIRPVSDGGVLQYRDVGVQFEGDNITPARLSYKLMLGNGVGYYGSNDKGDSHVAVTGQIGAEPVEGLKIIASGMFDRIEKGKSNPNGSITSLPDNGNLQLLVGSLAYMKAESKIEFIAEYLNQKSKFDNIGTKSSQSIYAYGGYKITDKLTPYVLYNYTQAGKSLTDGDPYCSPIPVRIDLLTAGLRYKFNSSFVAKMEYTTDKTAYSYQDIVMGGFTLDQGFKNVVRTHSLRLQLAFVF